MHAGTRRAMLAVLMLASTAWSQEPPKQGGLDQALAASRKSGRPIFAVAGSES